MRKQLAKALRQEGAVLEAIVLLLTADDVHQTQLSKGGSSHSSMDVEAGTGGASSCGVPSPGSSPSPHPPQPPQPQQQQSVSPADGVDEDGEPDFPVVQPSASEALSAALQRRLRGALRRGGAALSRVSSQLSMRGASVRAAKRTAEARAMGIHPDLFEVVEPIYAMSGPTAANLQVRGRGRCGAAPTWRGGTAASACMACAVGGWWPQILCLACGSACTSAPGTFSRVLPAAPKPVL